MQGEQGGAAQQGLQRGPHLARVELAWRLRQLQPDTSAGVGLVEAMEHYFCTFCHKAVVASDLAKYTGVLSGEERAQLRTAVRQAVRARCGVDATSSQGAGVDARAGHEQVRTPHGWACQSG